MDIIKEYFELRKKRDEILKMPMNSLTRLALESLEKSEIQKRLEKAYRGFTLVQFLKHTGKNDR